MELILLTITLVSSISIILPKWFLLVFFVPTLMIISLMEIIPPVFSLMDADIQIYDLILLVIGMRIAGPILLGKKKIIFYRIFSPIILFLTIMFAATIIAYFRFGGEIFVSEIIALLRFITQIIAFLFLIMSIRTEEEVERIHKSVEYIGYLIAFTIYINFILYPIGINFGEVMSSEGITRYFGPIGDQVSFIIIFYIVKKIIDKHLIGAGFFAGALLATGTRAAIIPLGISIIILAIRMKKEIRLTAKEIWILIIFCVLISSFTLLYNLGGMKTRFSTFHLEMGIKQRILTAGLALDVFWDNFFTGVGFTGFRYLGLDYGAWAIFTKNLFFSPNFIATAGNQFLQAATDGGVLALVSFAWLSIVILRIFKKSTIYSQGDSYNHGVAAYIWFFSLLVGNLTNSWLLPGSLISYFMWIILGLAVTKIHLASEKVLKWQHDNRQFFLGY